MNRIGTVVNDGIWPETDHGLRWTMASRLGSILLFGFTQHHEALNGGLYLYSRFFMSMHEYFSMDNGIRCSFYLIIARIHTKCPCIPDPVQLARGLSMSRSTEAR